MAGVLRCGRALKKAALDLVDRKHLAKWAVGFNNVMG